MTHAGQYDRSESGFYLLGFVDWQRCSYCVLENLGNKWKQYFGNNTESNSSTSSNSLTAAKQ